MDEFSDWHPRPRDVPNWREELHRAWAPRGSFTAMAPMIDRATNGEHKMHPAWERQVTGHAALWYVGADMCALLDAAAPQLPDTVLTKDLIPDEDGLVVFESPLSGLDSEEIGLGPVMVGAMLWGPALWEYDGTQMVGITIYGPYMAHPPWLMPLGSLIWPVGHGCDDSLNGTLPGGDNLTDTAVASMVEDRRRLLALWLLSSQRGLASSVRSVQDRATARRARRSGLDPAVRVVHLRQRPPASVGGEHSGYTLRHQFAVSGYWKQQHYGPGGSLRRPKWIWPYTKGPEDAPWLTSPKVKAWTR